MKPFDLEKAKAGAPLVTRAGEEAHFVAHVPEADKYYRVVVRVGGIVSAFSETGKYAGGEHHYDLFMAPVKRKVWLAIQGPTEPKYPGSLGWVYTDEAAARDAAPDVGRRFIEVEIEE